MGAMMEDALRLEQFLEEPILIPIDPFSYKPDDISTQDMVNPSVDSSRGFERIVFNMLDGLGYDIVYTTKSPFNALSITGMNPIVTGIGRHERRLIRQARVVSNISNVLQRESVIFVERSEGKNLEGTPTIGKDELREMQEPEEVRELILERKTE